MSQDKVVLERIKHIIQTDKLLDEQHKYVQVTYGKENQLCDPVPPS